METYQRSEFYQLFFSTPVQEHIRISSVDNKIDKRVASILHVVVECNNDAGCGNTEICTSNMCQPRQCNSNGQCAFGTDCFRGSCSATSGKADN